MGAALIVVRLFNHKLDIAVHFLVVDMLSNDGPQLADILQVGGGKFLNADLGLLRVQILVKIGDVTEKFVQNVLQGDVLSMITIFPSLSILSPWRRKNGCQQSVERRLAAIFNA